MILKYILCVFALLYGICALIAHSYHTRQVHHETIKTAGAR
jgi:hypothetical protein